MSENKILDTAKTLGFGTELEYTNISREGAARAIQSVVGGRISHTGGSYDAWTVTAPDGRKWKAVSDGSLGSLKHYQFSYKKWTKMVTAWGKIYKRDLFDAIRFPVGRLHEDEFTTYKLVDIAGVIVESNAHYYYYYQRNDSIMKSTNYNKIIDYTYALQERSMMIRAKYPNLLHDSGLWIFNQIFYQYLLCTIKKNEGSKKLKMIYDSEYGFYNKIIKRKKMKYWMMRKYPELLAKLYKLRY